MDCSSLEPYESCFVRKRSSTSSTIKQQVKNMVISFIEPKESFLPIFKSVFWERITEKLFVFGSCSYIAAFFYLFFFP